MVSEDGATLDAHPGATLEDGWLSLAEAAVQLGISLDAMRRRMRRGNYPRRQIRTRHGLSWQVRLEPIEPGTTLAPTVAPVLDVEPTVQALLAYLRERDQQRDREVSDLRSELAQARADVVDQMVQLTEAREQLRALLAPKSTESPISADSERGSPEPAQTPSKPTHRPWWRFWRA